MGVLDFLWQGSPPPSTTTYGTATTGIPQFLSDYTQGLLGKANAVAAEPFQAYGQPRLAQFTDAQQQAFKQTADMQGKWAGDLKGGIDYTKSAAGQNPFDASSQYVSSAMGINPLGEAGKYVGQAAGINPFDYSSKAFSNAMGMNASGAASPYLSNAMAVNAMEQSQPYYSSAMGFDASGAASPYIERASDINPMGMSEPYTSAAAKTFTGSNVADYMNPYMENVTNRIGELAGRNLQEQLMPAIGDQFIKAGQYGSSTMQQTVGRALRDVQESALAEQNKALAQGYQTAGQLFGQDATRQATLAGQQGQLGVNTMSQLGQLGSTTGTLANQQMANIANIGTARGNQALGQQQNVGQLGNIAGSLTNQQMANYGNLGNAMGNQALNYQQNLGNLGSTMGNVAASQMGQYGNLAQLASNMSNNYANNLMKAGSQMGQLGQMGQTMGLRDAAAMEAVGQTQQGQNQKNLDLAYKDFLEQRDYPKEQLAFMSNMLRGVPYGTSTSTSQTGPSSTYQASPLAQLAGSASLLTALGGLKFAEGGEVKKKRDPNRRSSRGRKRR